MKIDWDEVKNFVIGVIIMSSVVWIPLLLVAPFVKESPTPTPAPVIRLVDIMAKPESYLRDPVHIRGEIEKHLGTQTKSYMVPSFSVTFGPKGTSRLNVTWSSRSEMMSAWLVRDHSVEIEVFQKMYDGYTPLPEASGWSSGGLPTGVVDIIGQLVKQDDKYVLIVDEQSIAKPTPTKKPN